jgi:hypothetical protein
VLDGIKLNWTLNLKCLTTFSIYSLIEDTYYDLHIVMISISPCIYGFHFFLSIYLFIYLLNLTNALGQLFSWR